MKGQMRSACSAWLVVHAITLVACGEDESSSGGSSGSAGSAAAAGMSGSGTGSGGSAGTSGAGGSGGTSAQPGCDALGADASVPAGTVHSFDFDADAAGSLPAAFISVLGDWKVQAESSALSTPNVLRQTGSFTDPEFPHVVAKDLTFADLRVRVRCRPESGSIDQACGLVFRAADGCNYFITRANALESNLRLYKVVNGVRMQLASADLSITAGQWHTLEATARGSDLTVSWEGAQQITATDATFARGKVGLWTKADSVSAFDDFEATAE